MMTAQDVLKPYGINNYRELSVRSGLNLQRAHQIWNGQTGIGGHAAMKINKALGIPLELLLTIKPGKVKSLR